MLFTSLRVILKQLNIVFLNNMRSGHLLRVVVVGLRPY